MSATAPRRSRGTWVAGALLIGYLVVGAALVLAPSANVPDLVINWVTHHLEQLGVPAWDTKGRVSFGLNVALFVPLTLLGSFLVPRWSWIRLTGVGMLTSCLVELTQWAFLPDRQATLVDVAANTMGAALGALLARPFRPAVAVQ